MENTDSLARSLSDATCNLLAGVIYHLQEVAIDKQAREYPARKNQQKRADSAQNTSQEAIYSDAILTTETRAKDSPLSAKEEGHSKRA